MDIMINEMRSFLVARTWQISEKILDFLVYGDNESNEWVYFFLWHEILKNLFFASMAKMKWVFIF